MTLSDFKPDKPDDELTQEDVAEQIEVWTGVERTPRSNGYSFYARSPGGKPKRGTLFAAVLPGPRLCVDPTAKESVSGETPEEILEHPDFEDTVSWDSSLGYSIKLDSEIPEVTQLAVERSYGLFLASSDQLTRSR